MELFIKNMVSARCKLTVKFEFAKLNVDCASIELGRVITLGFISPEKVIEIKVALKQSGLELIESKKSILIERIKNVIIDMIHYLDDRIKINFSLYLSQRLNLDYTYLANIFSEAEGITIEHFIIAHKIQRIKELIGYKELSLTQISWKLHYSSVAHLSNQFKKVTGITPSQFKNLEYSGRVELENV